MIKPWILFNESKETFTVEMAQEIAYYILDEEGNVIGLVTSGTVGPTVKAKISMGYVDKPFMKSGTRVQVRVRNKVNPAVVTKMPFVQANYYTGN